MQGLDTLTFVYFAVIVIAAFAVKGASGLGGNMFAVPLLALALPLQTAASVLTLFTIVAAAPQMARDWRAISWAEVFRVLPFTLIGVLAGYGVFHVIDPRLITRAFGAFIVIYAVCSLVLAKRKFTIAPRARWPLVSGLSIMAGLVGFMFGGGSTPFYAIYLNSQQLLKTCFRVTITTITAVQAIFRVTGYGSLGFYDDTALALLLAGVPLVLLGTYAGMWVGTAMSQQNFSRMLGAILVCSGFALMAK